MDTKFKRDFAGEKRSFLKVYIGFKNLVVPTGFSLHYIMCGRTGRRVRTGCSIDVRSLHWPKSVNKLNSRVPDQVLPGALMGCFKKEPVTLSPPSGYTCSQTAECECSQFPIDDKLRSLAIRNRWRHVTAVSGQ